LSRSSHSDQVTRADRELPIEGQRERSKAERRSRIVRAARDLIRETGNTDLSMRIIAQRANVSFATPYNLFGSKHAVVLAVFEDEQDFTERFGRLKAKNAIERILKAHDLAMGYLIEDPEFYRPLWKALLNSQGDDTTGLATPKRLERNRTAWLSLLGAAQDEGLLDPVVTADALERILSSLASGSMLAWATGVLPTARVLPLTGLGYALALRGASTVKGARILAPIIAGYQLALSATK
jgi:AcrR family transcriptional regulator